ncbi:unnamed protein product [Vitrella brassicaformis CCMP3155]|uniref:Glycosyl transferase family 1 domain-containing protein n=2 Tax=Vitrella brassicaformis TaxID=1169539 RepID=A0A0G4FB90_VITBC|nr:unnamed protein product [Vitrella brassicaformis CCMP3155]|mmetsp:Transcript_16469/g.39534  ORF Transcript_16469/g.39534 Transcript_16469/m.39534 type:complete len:665 (+) Transcript_16469:144-2138(+)|eukprot:CEM09910.1 unnamed protein product [Vitrella brassicaformis CCMP3155]
MYGTVLLCAQNMAVSGANQVLLNIVEGGLFQGQILLLSPSRGPFEEFFNKHGVGVVIGTLDTVLQKARDIRYAVCNTIMTAHIVCRLADLNIPHFWILHEWWPLDDMLPDELAKRNVKFMDTKTVRQAFKVCNCVVNVSHNQRAMYGLKDADNADVVHVGVPPPNDATSFVEAKLSTAGNKEEMIILVLGIVCPRKNQHTAVRIFKKLAGDRKDVRLVIVGARYIRDYEIEYVEQVKQEIGDDSRIELHEVTKEPDRFYRRADVLLVTSLNEVTPMVIPEAMMRGLPVVTTDIAGIPEMLTHGTHGFVYPPEQEDSFVEALSKLVDDPQLRADMGKRASEHAMATFALSVMTFKYCKIALSISPTIILIDMDGTLVDWDAGFYAHWKDRSSVDRTVSYAMEECVPKNYRQEAMDIFHSKGFFLNLPPYPGAIEALKAMTAAGYEVWIATSPIKTSHYCAQEKLEWVLKHLGQEWIAKTILTQDKTVLRGDFLIDDKPFIKGAQQAHSWHQIIFDQPYNGHRGDLSRMYRWTEWQEVLDEALSQVAHLDDVPSSPPKSPLSPFSPDALKWQKFKEEVDALPDFSSYLKGVDEWRKDYTSWRTGKGQGAKGDVRDVLKSIENIKREMALLNMDETQGDPAEMHIFRKGYTQWRRGSPSGARGGPLG